VLPGRKYTPEDLLSLAWRRKWLIGAVMLFISMAAVAVSLKMPNLYQAETRTSARR
jgi:uncharacterized protein involved in exopolysaccharide biosynthesis